MEASLQVVQPLGVTGMCTVQATLINYLNQTFPAVLLSLQVGTFLCVFAMFAMDWITALITMVLTGCLYLYIFYRKPGLVLILSSVLIEISFSSEANWGSSAQAQVFVNALKGVQVCFSVRLTYGWLFVVDASVDSMFPFDVSDLDTYFVFLQSLTDTADHVKNYRPKLIVLTGNPATRSYHHILSAQI